MEFVLWIWPIRDRHRSPFGQAQLRIEFSSTQRVRMDLAHAGNFGMNFGENLPEKKNKLVKDL
jgi:hypothetical protein